MNNYEVTQAVAIGCMKSAAAAIKLNKSHRHYDGVQHKKAKKVYIPLLNHPWKAQSYKRYLAKKEVKKNARF